MPSSRKNSLRSVDEEHEEEEEVLGAESIMMQLFEDVEAACDPFRSQHNSPTGSFRISRTSAPRLSLPTSFDSAITPTQATFSSGLYDSLISTDEPACQQRTTRGSSLPELSQHHPHHQLAPIQPLKLVKLRKQGTRPVIPQRTSSFGWEETDLNSASVNKSSRRFPLPPTHLPVIKVKGNTSDLEGAVAESERELEECRAQLAAKDPELPVLQQKIAGLERSLQEKERSVNDLRRDIGTQTKAVEEGKKKLPPTPTRKSSLPLSPSPSLTSSFSSSTSSPTFLLTPPPTPGSSCSSNKARNAAEAGTIRTGSKMDALENFLRGMDFGDGEGKDGGVDQMAERKARREEVQKWGRWEGREVKEWRGKIGGGGRRF